MSAFSANESINSIKLLTLTICIILSLNSTISEEIICNNTNLCQNQILQCSNRKENCFFTCLDEHSCSNSTFICPSTVPLCTIQCNDDNSCQSTNIICSRNSKCNITANGKYSLAYSKINGPYQQETIVSCHQDYACKNAWIDSRHSTNLHLVCDTNTQYDGCQDITLYCPYQQQLIDQPTCTVKQTDSETQTAAHHELTIYALNSWKDMDISWNVAIDGNSRMFCGDDYKYWCSIKNPMTVSDKTEKNEIKWNCMDKSSYCYVNYDGNNEDQIWNEISNVNVDTAITIIFIVTFSITLILSCRYGHEYKVNISIDDLDDIKNHNEFIQLKKQKRINNDPMDGIGETKELTKI